MKPLRACPVCPKCGSKKFTRLSGNVVKVKCRKCDNEISLEIKNQDS